MAAATVLVVDDDAVMLASVSRMLSRQGYHVCFRLLGHFRPFKSSKTDIGFERNYPYLVLFLTFHTDWRVGGMMLNAL
jgi:hypothetical protein